VTLDGCQTNALAAHFGEQRQQPCGHCSWCATGVSRVPPRQTAEIDEALWRQVETLQGKQATLLANPRRLARLLCGIASPGLSRGKLTGHDLFGRLEQTPFAAVLRKAEQGVDASQSRSE
jgi:ATP-dependent DNA helicase RecQ